MHHNYIVITYHNYIVIAYHNYIVIAYHNYIVIAYAIVPLLPNLLWCHHGHFIHSSQIHALPTMIMYEKQETANNSACQRNSLYNNLHLIFNYTDSEWEKAETKSQRSQETRKRKKFSKDTGSKLFLPHITAGSLFSIWCPWQVGKYISLVHYMPLHQEVQHQVEH